jgi:signal peptidase
VLVIAGDALLTVAAVLGIVGFALFVGVRTGKVQTLVVISESMVPVYEVDDVVIARSVPASTLRVGDVASLPRGDGLVVTHRVVATEPDPAGPAGTMLVRMKGDANKAEDARQYEVRTALVPVLTIPGAGQVTRLVSRPAVAVPVVITVLALVGIALLSGPSRRTDDPALDPPPDRAASGDRDPATSSGRGHGPASPAKPG